MEHFRALEEEAKCLGDLLNTLAVATSYQEGQTAPETMPSSDNIVDLMELVCQLIESDPNPHRLHHLLFEAEEGPRVIPLIVQFIQTELSTEEAPPYSTSLTCRAAINLLQQILKLAAPSEDTIDPAFATAYARLLKSIVEHLIEIHAVDAILTVMATDYDRDTRAAAVECISYLCQASDAGRSAVVSKEGPALLLGMISKDRSATVRRWACVVIHVIMQTDGLAFEGMEGEIVAGMRTDPSPHVRGYCAEILIQLFSAIPGRIASLTQSEQLARVVKERLQSESEVMVVDTLLRLLELLFASAPDSTPFIEAFIDAAGHYALIDKLDAPLATSALVVRVLRLLVQVAAPARRFGYLLVGRFHALSQLLSVCEDPTRTVETEEMSDGDYQHFLRRQVELALLFAWICASDKAALQLLNDELVAFPVWMDTVGKALMNSLLLLDHSSLVGMVLYYCDGMRINGLGCDRLGEGYFEFDPRNRDTVIHVKTRELAEDILATLEAVALPSEFVVDLGTRAPTRKDEEEAQIALNMRLLESASLPLYDDAKNDRQSPYPEYDAKLTYSLLLRALAAGVCPPGASPSSLIGTSKAVRSPKPSTKSPRSPGRPAKSPRSPGRPMRTPRSHPSASSLGQRTIRSPRTLVGPGSVSKSPRIAKSPRVKKSPRSRSSTGKQTRALNASGSPRISHMMAKPHTQKLDISSDHPDMQPQSRSEVLRFEIRADEICEEKMIELYGRCERFRSVLNKKLSTLPLKVETRVRRHFLQTQMKQAQKYEKQALAVFKAWEEFGDDLVRQGVEILCPFQVLTPDTLAILAKVLVRKMKTYTETVERLTEEQKEAKVVWKEKRKKLRRKFKKDNEARKKAGEEALPEPNWDDFQPEVLALDPEDEAVKTVFITVDDVTYDERRKEEQERALELQRLEFIESARPKKRVWKRPQTSDKPMTAAEQMKAEVKKRKMEEAKRMMAKNAKEDEDDTISFGTPTPAPGTPVPAQSVQPAQPAQLIEAAQPTQPVELEQPTQPVEPEQPTQSVEPEQPTQPVEPAQPTQPVQTDPSSQAPLSTMPPTQPSVVSQEAVTSEAAVLDPQPIPNVESEIQPLSSESHSASEPSTMVAAPDSHFTHEHGSLEEQDSQSIDETVLGEVSIDHPESVTGLTVSSEGEPQNL